MIFLATFLSTLISHGSIIIIVSLLSFLAISVLKHKNSFVKLSLNEFIFFSILIFSITLSCFLFSQDRDPTISLSAREALINNYISLVSVSIICIFILSWLHNGFKEFDRAIRLVIIFHVVSILFQMLYFIIFQDYFDFVKPFTGLDSRFLNYDSSSMLTKFRFTGWYIEPSTYSSVMTALLASRILLSKIKGTRNTAIDYVAGISIILTFSTAALFYGLLILSILLYQDFNYLNKKSKVLIVLFVTIIGLIGLGLVIDEIFTKLNQTSEIRFGLIDYILNRREGYRLLFGYGAFGVEDELYRLANNEYVGIRLASLNDSGLGIYLGLKFGVIGAILILSFFSLLLINNKVAMLIFLCLLLTKLSYVHVVTFIPLILIYYDRFYSENNVSTRV